MPWPLWIQSPWAPSLWSCPPTQLHWHNCTAPLPSFLIFAPNYSAQSDTFPCDPPGWPFMSHASPVYSEDSLLYSDFLWQVYSSSLPDWSLHSWCFYFLVILLHLMHLPRALGLRAYIRLWLPWLCQGPHYGTYQGNTLFFEAQAIHSPASVPPCAWPRNSPWHSWMVLALYSLSLWQSHPLSPVTMWTIPSLMCCVVCCPDAHAQGLSQTPSPLWTPLKSLHSPALLESPHSTVCLNITSSLQGHSLYTCPESSLHTPYIIHFLTSSNTPRSDLSLCERCTPVPLTWILSS